MDRHYDPDRHQNLISCCSSYTAPFQKVVDNFLSYPDKKGDIITL